MIIKVAINNDAIAPYNTYPTMIKMMNIVIFIRRKVISFSITWYFTALNPWNVA